MGPGPPVTSVLASGPALWLGLATICPYLHLAQAPMSQGLEKVHFLVLISLDQLDWATGAQASVTSPACILCVLATTSVHGRVSCVTSSWIFHRTLLLLQGKTLIWSLY